MHNSYMWVYRNGGLKDNHHAVVCDFHKTRKKEAPAEFLRGFKGTLVTDGYQVYYSLENDKSTEFIVAGCWAHYPNNILIQEKMLESRSELTPAVYLPVQRFKRFCYLTLPLS